MKLRHGVAAAACGAIALLTVSPAASAVESPNLLVNGGAEVGDASLSGQSAVTIPGWQVSGSPTVIPYGTVGFPSKSEGPADGGNQFFGGGDIGNSTLSQSVDLSGAAAQVDSGEVPFTLSGWLGGNGSDQSNATVTVSFLDAGGRQLGRAASIGPVTALNRLFTTELLLRSTTGTVPPGTRTASVVVSFAEGSALAHKGGYADDLSLTIGAALPAPPPLTPPVSRVGTLDHIFMVYMEDAGDSDIVGNSQAPYINSLINQYGFASNYHALTHPSDPNYIPILGGSDFGIHTDCSLSCTVNEPNLLDEMDAAGVTWTFYEESMPSPCYEHTAGRYYSPDELPWVYFSDIVNNAALCSAHIVPLTQMSTDLQNPNTAPNFVWFEPNSCDSMRQCGIAAGDSWLQQTLSTIFNSPTWTNPSQRSAVFITWDEDKNNPFGVNPFSVNNQPNTVPMIVTPSQGAVTSGMRSGSFTATDYYSHYSLLRTIEDALGLAPLTNNDRYATPLNEFWP